ncbi:2,3-dihydroxyphenylpropionate/2,3-dihydroxicinnamic acid 1,2-dioxygenase [Streptomyces sp. RB5]|uniref:2,3-dihydroxyphenylpropionate/2, 3-dihydroxicinnamic acid 1,2-dioxygenase n=1 Tax=Streptomyces smaragdinus TaxID=2585196 RepID=A0A7K0CE54_9ACTN|nr:hypothetical protein [Streptomyces smaragdinus]MQY11757.1 2,3-dihydroxyphenylpropionate/2,3-dihydroxicinnamic acid 1,2-dioxygenase [Streptomyces smaragdinus]
MAVISLAMAASHAPGLTGWFDKAPEADRRIVRAAYDAIHDEIVASGTQLLIIVGNDHVANARVGDLPDFTFALSDRIQGPDEWFKPWLRVADYDLPGAPEAGTRLFEALRDSGLDLRGRTDGLRYDDNVSVPVTMSRIADTGVAVLPLLQNCTVPPLPDEKACYRFGEQLAEAIRTELPADLRVGLLGSGGLSHEPGGRRYLEIDEKFDRWWMDLLVEGDHERILAEATFDRMEQAGSGGTAELLSWSVVMGAVGPRPCTSLGYVAFDEWRCGVGAVRWQL